MIASGKAPPRTIRTYSWGRLTIVEVAQVARIEEKVGSEKFSKATLAWSEGQWGVEVQAPSPVCLPSQVVS